MSLETLLIVLLIVFVIAALLGPRAWPQVERLSSLLWVVAIVVLILFLLRRI